MDSGTENAENSQPAENAFAGVTKKEDGLKGDAGSIGQANPNVLQMALGKFYEKYGHEISAEVCHELQQYGGNVEELDKSLLNRFGHGLKEFMVMEQLVVPMPVVENSPPSSSSSSSSAAAAAAAVTLATADPAVTDSKSAPILTESKKTENNENKEEKLNQEKKKVTLQTSGKRQRGRAKPEDKEFERHQKRAKQSFVNQVHSKAIDSFSKFPMPTTYHAASDHFMSSFSISEFRSLLEKYQIKVPKKVRKLTLVNEFLKAVDKNQIPCGFQNGIIWKSDPGRNETPHHGSQSTKYSDEQLNGERGMNLTNSNDHVESKLFSSSSSSASSSATDLPILRHQKPIPVVVGWSFPENSFWKTCNWITDSMFH